MKNIIIDFYKKFKQAFLIIIGFSILVIYIYMTFIRERLPRDIPFQLTEFNFYALCLICLGFVYNIYRMLYPKPLSTFIIQLLYFISTPLRLFLEFVKKNKLVAKVFYGLWLDFIPLFDRWGYYDNVFFIYMISIIPRIIILLIFVFDIFYLHKIEAYYYFILLNLFPIVYLLFIKYLESIMEKYIQILELLYSDVVVFEKSINNADFIHNPKAIYHDKTVTIRKYIEIQFEAYINYGENEEYIEYEGSPYSTEWRYEQYQRKFNKLTKDLTIKDFNLLHEEFNYIMPNILSLKIFLDFSLKNINKNSYIFNIKLFISLIYLLTWMYILFISLHTLKDLSFTITFLELLLKYYALTDPFSDINITKS